MAARRLFAMAASTKKHATVRGFQQSGPSRMCLVEERDGLVSMITTKRLDEP
jgi:hypothetical protein